MKWYSLDMTVEPESLDALRGILLLCDAVGLEENDGRICAWFSTNEHARAALHRIGRTIPSAVGHLSSLPDRDWNAAWRETMEPIQLSRGIWVSPRWLPPPSQGDEHWIILEPGTAFGTGHHETTRLCAQAIASCAESLTTWSFLDIGTGTGILCLAADFYGAVRCIGIDNDRRTAPVMAENLHGNPARHRIDFVVATVSALSGQKLFNLIALNGLRTWSDATLPDVSVLIRPDGRFIWSGIPACEENEVVSLAEKHGFALESGTTLGDWWCGIFTVSGSTGTGV